MGKENLEAVKHIAERAVVVGKHVTKFAMMPLRIIPSCKNVVTTAWQAGNGFIGLFARPHMLADELSDLDVLHKDTEYKILVDLTENVADSETVRLGVASVCQRAMELLKTELDAESEAHLDKVLSALVLVDVERMRTMSQLSESDFTILQSRLEPYYQKQLEARTGNAPV